MFALLDLPTISLCLCFKINLRIPIAWQASSISCWAFYFWRQAHMLPRLLVKGDRSWTRRQIQILTVPGPKAYISPSVTLLPISSGAAYVHVIHHHVLGIRAPVEFHCSRSTHIKRQFFGFYFKSALSTLTTRVIIYHISGLTPTYTCRVRFRSDLIFAATFLRR